MTGVDCIYLLIFFEEYSKGKNVFSQSVIQLKTISFAKMSIYAVNIVSVEFYFELI